MPSQANSSASSENAGAGPGDAGPAPSAPVDPGAEGEKANPAVEAFNRISQDAAELKEYASYYVAAKIDGFRRTLRNLGLYAALGVLGLIAGGAVLATAAGLIVIGIAEAFTSLFGGRAWLGDIVAGIVVLSVIATAVWLMMNKLTGSWHSQTLKKYHERKQSQRERFGHDVGQRAGKGQADGTEKAK